MLIKILTLLWSFTVRIYPFNVRSRNKYVLMSEPHVLEQHTHIRILWVALESPGIHFDSCINDRSLTLYFMWIKLVTYHWVCFGCPHICFNDHSLINVLVRESYTKDYWESDWKIFIVHNRYHAHLSASLHVCHGMCTCNVWWSTVYNTQHIGQFVTFNVHLQVCNTLRWLIYQGKCFIIWRCIRPPFS